MKDQNFIFVEEYEKENVEVYNKILKICLFPWTNELLPNGNLVFYHRSHKGTFEMNEQKILWIPEVHSYSGDLNIIENIYMKSQIEKR